MNRKYNHLIYTDACAEMMYNMREQGHSMTYIGRNFTYWDGTDWIEIDRNTVKERIQHHVHKLLYAQDSPVVGDIIPERRTEIVGFAGC